MGKRPGQLDGLPAVSAELQEYRDRALDDLKARGADLARVASILKNGLEEARTRPEVERWVAEVGGRSEREIDAVRRRLIRDLRWIVGYYDERVTWTIQGKPGRPPGYGPALELLKVLTELPGSIRKLDPLRPGPSRYRQPRRGPRERPWLKSVRADLRAAGCTADVASWLMITYRLALPRRS